MADSVYRKTIVCVAILISFFLTTSVFAQVDYAGYSKYLTTSHIDYSDPLSIGLLGWWYMADGYGRLVTDMCLAGYHGEFHVNLAESTWNTDRGMYFDGTAQDFVVLPLEPNSSWTFFADEGTEWFNPDLLCWSVWINPDVVVGFRGITGFEGTPGNNNRGIVALNERIEYQATGNNVRYRYYWTDNDFLTVGEWYHVVVMSEWDGLPTCYVNGVEEPMSLRDSNGGVPTRNQPTEGFIGYFGGDYFTGKIDDVRVYNRRLTPEEISILYHTPRRPLYRPDEGYATITGAVSGQIIRLVH